MSAFEMKNIIRRVLGRKLSLNAGPKFSEAEDILVYKHCFWCNGIFKQKVPTQGYCSYYCKSIVSEYINNHNGMNLGLGKSNSPIYKDRPSERLLKKFPNNQNSFKNYLIEFKQAHGHLYWNKKEVQSVIKKEEDRLTRHYKNGWLTREEIEEFEKIGWKWTRTERKNEMIALNLNQQVK